MKTALFEKDRMKNETSPEKEAALESVLLIALQQHDLKTIQSTVKNFSFSTPENLNDEFIFLRYHLKTAVLDYIKKWIQKKNDSHKEQETEKLYQLLTLINHTSSADELLAKIKKHIRTEQPKKAFFPPKKGGLNAMVGRIVQSFSDMQKQKRFKTFP